MAMFEQQQPQPHHYRRFVEDTTTTTTTNGHPRTYHSHREEFSDSALNNSTSTSNSRSDTMGMRDSDRSLNPAMSTRTPPPTPVSGSGGNSSRSYHYQRSTRSFSPAMNHQDMEHSTRSLDIGQQQHEHHTDMEPQLHQRDDEGFDFHKDQSKKTTTTTTTTTTHTAPPASHNYTHFDESHQTMRPTSASSTSSSRSTSSRMRHNHIRTGVDTGITKPPHTLGSFGPRPEWHSSAPDLSSSFRDLRTSSPAPSDGGFGSNTSLSTSQQWQRSTNSLSSKTPTEIRDLGAYYLIKVEAPGHPGLQARDIHVRLLEDRKLQISGEFFEEHIMDLPDGKGTHRVERNRTTFTKTFTIPENADLYSIQAFVDGSTVNVRVDKKPDLRHEIPVHTRF